MTLFDIKPQSSSEQVEFPNMAFKNGDDMIVDKATSTPDLSNTPYAFTPTEERNARRKIDTWLMPIIFTTYGIQYIDKVILNTASQFGIIQDLHLSQIVGYNAQHVPIVSSQRYSNATLIFYWGYLCGGMLAAHARTMLCAP